MCSNCGVTTKVEAGQAFADRLMNMLNESALSMMLSIGHRTRLFDVMSELEASTSGQIAKAAGLSERYVREWLGAMTTGRIVEHDREAGTYWLPAEHAAYLTRAVVPNNLAAVMQWFSVLGGAESRVVEAFKTGRGVPYEAYERFNEVMAEESGQTVVAALEEHILPLSPGLVERLKAGIEVLDVGCGSGWTLIRLAELFPKSRFTGYDLLPTAIDSAKCLAVQRGVGNVRFEARDVSKPFGEEMFDLITTFDAVHDQARPDVVLANIHRALKPDGTYLMQDIAARTAHADNMDHPMGTFIYTISCMHCMSVSLAQGGMGLGAAWGREKAMEMLAEAGFGDVRVEQLEHDVMNYWYITGKAEQLAAAA